MGRAQPGMEDDGPIADACKMPSFISSFEEGRARLSRNLPTETSLTDGKVERPTGDPSSRRRSNSRLSLDREPEKRSGEEGEEEEEQQEQQEEEERDAEGNNNNNCNGGGSARRRASVAEILRRNFGDLRSPALRANADSRMQRGAEHESHQGRVRNDAADENGSECGECKKSDGGTGEAGTQNEPTLSELATSDVVVEYLTVTGRCHQKRDSDGGRVALDECFSAEEHIYCTVYCIADDGHLKDAELPERQHEAFTRDTPEMDPEEGRGAGSTPEPTLYTLDDLVDPFGDLSYRLYKEQAGTEAAVQSCRVCLEEATIASLPCCRKAVCDECLKLYVSSQVKVGKVYVSCPIPECNGSLEEGAVISHLTKEDLAKYRYFLELSQLDSSTKPCPQCSHFTSLKAHNPNRSEHKYKIQCSNCQFVWCFKCHAPWHDGIKCRDYRKGDKLLRSWASVIEHGQRNAQKCPQCKIHIQRTEGCDHMTCTQCNTNFCYRCGEGYRHLRFFGDHTSNLSVFGCKYRYLPNKPHLRRLIRGSVCATKLLIAPVVILLVVVLGALAMVIGLVVFPVYYVCKRRKKQHTRGSGRWI